MVLSLSGQPWNEASNEALTPATRMNLAILVGVVIAGMIATALGGYRSITPSLRWYVAGAEPDEGQRRTAINLVRTQSPSWWPPGRSAAPCSSSPIQTKASARLSCSSSPSSFGCTSSVSTSLLFTQRIVRSIVAAASTSSPAA